jgi:hypothetical protein
MPTLAPGKLVIVDDIPVVVVRLLAEGLSPTFNSVMYLMPLTSLSTDRGVFSSISCDAGYRRPKHKDTTSCTEADASQG